MAGTDAILQSLNALNKILGEINKTLGNIVGTGTTGTGAVVFQTTPTINQPNIVGTTTNNNAAAGSVGEYISSTVVSGSAVALTTAMTANVTSISLTAGDWDVSGNVVIAAAATTVATVGQAAISSSTGALPTLPGAGAFNIWQGSFTGAASLALPTGRTRISLAITTTIYLVAQATFATSTAGAYGFIGARRVR